MWQDFKNLYHLLRSFLASVYFGFPSKKLTVIGVTGTDGKTTTTNMIYHILKLEGKKVSMISSVNAIIGKVALDTGFHVTTPDPWQVQKLLKKAVDSGQEYFVLEATSHGLDQNRIANIDFKVAVITNITHEHLDYHGSWENYSKSKGKLFENAQISILNLDDSSYTLLKKNAGGKVITYSKSMNADFNLKEYPINLKIPGAYNLSNALAASAAASTLGISKSKILKALSNFEGVSGRMEKIDAGQNFAAIVDFAHTPNSLKQALKSLRESIRSNRSSKLIAVFGAAGERDREKRPKMGEVAAEYADITILTAEDPRSERVEDISEQIAKGLTKLGKRESKDFFKINDRKEAIQFAVNLANTKDIVVTFGKSHEKSMCFGKTEYPWDEFEEFKKAIKNKSK